jgi:hypothetical protein
VRVGYGEASLHVVPSQTARLSQLSRVQVLCSVQQSTGTLPCTDVMCECDVMVGCSDLSAVCATEEALAEARRSISSAASS